MLPVRGMMACWYVSFAMVPGRVVCFLQQEVQAEGKHLELGHIIRIRTNVHTKGSGVVRRQGPLGVGPLWQRHMNPKAKDEGFDNEISGGYAL
ncbi:hypothetical protein QBC35DRAFT_496655 [Podospora australis]|uniref:Secreted protein n=1 Tax=Podospora australis TaxID=1536484 RepID=A0AAN7AJV3_9PEZI|nr:hypothetical protein QBC35DRAFT_496655 [Podospora australis]